ncbi:MAG TPA: hypothetical protein VG477_03630 [Thermoanaerobaculia bacterium]|nr:hypothetical protein [Thermoanaerobaculia bacterium]
MRPLDTGGMRPPTLGDAVNGVRWDFDPSRRLLSPLVATARYFESFPWDGEAEEPATPGDSAPIPRP